LTSQPPTGTGWANIARHSLPWPGGLLAPAVPTDPRATRLSPGGTAQRPDHDGAPRGPPPARPAHTPPAAWVDGYRQPQLVPGRTGPGPGLSRRGPQSPGPRAGRSAGRPVHGPGRG